MASSVNAVVTAGQMAAMTRNTATLCSSQHKFQAMLSAAKGRPPWPLLTRVVVANMVAPR